MKLILAASVLCLAFSQFLLNFDSVSSQLTQLEMRQKFNASDFVYDMDNATIKVTRAGGTLIPCVVSQMPALANQKISYVLHYLEPCGIFTPEVHPRAAEFIYVIDGSNLQVGFSEENGGRFIVNVLQKGQVMIIPQGLIHFQQNLGCGIVKYMSALNSEDPGVLAMAQQTFGLPAYALASTFNRTEAEIAVLKAGLPPGPAAGYGNCVTRCIRSRK